VSETPQSRITASKNVFSNDLSYTRVQGLLLKNIGNYMVKNCYRFFQLCFEEFGTLYTQSESNFNEVYEGLNGKAV
jgi:hypothetical protein